VADSQPPDDLVELVTNADRDKFAVSLQVVAHHMTTTAAKAEIEMERLRSAVPARQQTARHAITAVIVAAAGTAIYFKPAIGWPVAALVAVLGGASLIEQIKKGKADKS